MRFPIPAIAVFAGTSIDEREEQEVILTKELIEANKTPAGGYTRSQLEAIGVAWPPKKGWKKGSIGKEISEHAFREFSRGRVGAGSQAI